MAWGANCELPDTEDTHIQASAFPIISSRYARISVIFERRELSTLVYSYSFSRTVMLLSCSKSSLHDD